MVTAGPHLGIIRSFVQRKATNGERITWGSQELANLRSCTMAELENLAQDIHDGVMREVLGNLPQLCDDFAPWGGKNRSFIICKNCELNEWLHEEKKRLSTGF